MSKMYMLQIRVSKKMNNALFEIAKRNGTDKSKFVRKLIKSAIKKDKVVIEDLDGSTQRSA
jgi:predicted DNA-binding protein